MSSFIHSRRGQTLVEALVALSILTTGFVGIVALLTKSFQLNRTTTDNTQATYLAAEGIEVAKNIIDYDGYYGLAQSAHTDDWGCSFGLSAGQSVDYALAYDTTVTDCSAPLPPLTTDQLYLAPSHLYTYNDFGAAATDFKRDVWITVPAGSPNELDVRSVVTWSSGSLSNTITLEDHFYDWRPQ